MTIAMRKRDGKAFVWARRHSRDLTCINSCKRHLTNQSHDISTRDAYHVCVTDEVHCLLLARAERKGEARPSQGPLATRLHGLLVMTSPRPIAKGKAQESRASCPIILQPVTTVDIAWQGV